jgi:hypothetical protein
MHVEDFLGICDLENREGFFEFEWLGPFYME